MTLGRFLSAADAQRVYHVLDKLALHGFRDFALTGSLALETHLAGLGYDPLFRSLNDVDIVVASFASIAPALADSFLFRHIHPHVPEGKTLSQLVDPAEALRLDIFRAYGATLARSRTITCDSHPLSLVSLEDLAARTAALVIGLVHGSPVPLKHAHDFQRLEAIVDRGRVEIAWRDHRRRNDPETFQKVCLQLRDLIPLRADLLIVPTYSQDADFVCPRCEDTGYFRRAPARTILSILGYC